MSATLQGPYGSIELGYIILGVGRSPENQLILQDPEASGLHAQISPQGPDYIIVDLESKNGTFVNGQRLAPRVPRRLNNGDTVRFGNTTFNYMNRASPYPPTRAAAPSSFSNVGSFQPPPPSAVRPDAPSQPQTVSIEKGGNRKRNITIGGIIGGLASLVTIITFILTFSHPTPASPTPAPGSNSPASTPASSIPRLHSSYTGTYNFSDNITPSRTLIISSLTEKANGDFTAVGNFGGCPETIDGTVSSDNSITLTATSALCNGDRITFSGSLHSDGQMSGDWQDVGAGSGGTWTAA